MSKLSRIDAAFQKAQTPRKGETRAEGWLVNKREFGSIVDAAKADDGKVSRYEAQQIAYHSFMMYTSFTPAGRDAAESFARKYGVGTRPEDFFGGK